jgi:effector-binding domain-containing protein
MTPDALTLTPKTIPPFVALVSSQRTTLKRLSECEPVMHALYNEATRLNLTINGPSQWHYIGASGDDSQEFQLDIVLPIQQVGASPETCFYKEMPGFACVSHEHTGPWSDMPTVYDQVFAQFYRDGYTEGNIVREIHTVVDINDPTKCITEVQVEVMR